MLDQFNSLKNFVNRHKTGILLGALFATSVTVFFQRRGLNQRNEFLKKHNLYEQFNAPRN